VLKIAKGLAATLGTDFFNSVVKHIVSVFHADCGYIAELSGEPAERVRTLAFFRKRRKSENFDQRISGTASGQVLMDGWFACSKDAAKVFQADDFLQEEQGEGYAGVRLSNSSGQPIGVLAIVSKVLLTDIQLIKSVLTALAPRAAAELERKRFEDLHLQNEQRYQAFISSNPDAMWRIEFPTPIPLTLSEDEQIDLIYRSGYLAECNEALARYFGAAKPEELIGYPFDMLASRINVNAREELRAAVRTKFRSSTVETMPVDQDGNRSFRVRSQFGIVEDDALQRIWGTTRDVTELRRAEFSLVTSERVFLNVLEGIKLPAMILDANGVLTYGNEYLLRLMGRSREEARNLNWMEKAAPPEEAHVWKLVLTKPGEGEDRPTHFRGVLADANGVRREILWDTIIIYDPEGKANGLAAIGRDILYQEALDQDVLQAQKLATISRVAGNIAERFDRHVGNVLGHISDLLETTSRNDPSYPNLLAMLESASSCADQTRKLLAIGRKQHLQPKSIILSIVVSNAEAPIRKLLGKGIVLVLDLATSLWPVYADPVQIQQVLTILVTNARDAMPMGGELIIATSNLSVGVGDQSYPGLVPGPYVRLSLTDNGAGIEPELRAHVFEPYISTKSGGDGLGLATVHGIVAQSAGHISVVSDPNKGTSIEILLPATIVAL
jgi:PAS domain S-box-containing protein